MTNFHDRYRDLENGFRERAAMDRSEFGYDCTYLPNIRPSRPVHYILVASEPSLSSC